jgi:hypothetical protein
MTFLFLLGEIVNIFYSIPNLRDKLKICIKKNTVPNYISQKLGKVNSYIWEN